jgi:hypothetical protein
LLVARLNVTVSPGFTAPLQAPRRQSQPPGPRRLVRV